MSGVGVGSRPVSFSLRNSLVNVGGRDFCLCNHYSRFIYIGHTNVTHPSLKCAQNQTLKQAIRPFIVYCLYEYVNKNFEVWCDLLQIIIQAYIQEFFSYSPFIRSLNQVKNTVNTSLDTGGLKKYKTLKWQNLNLTITTLCYLICSNVLQLVRK